MTQRNQFIEKQRNNGKMGGRPKTQIETQPITQIKPNTFFTQMPFLMLIAKQFYIVAYFLACQIGAPD